MAKLVVLTDVAKRDIEEITDYIFENWGNAICNKFLARFEEVCNIISATPRMYSLIHKKERIRKCILTKQNTIYYRERRYRIEILAIFDTRQNPDKLTQIIRSK